MGLEELLGVPDAVVVDGSGKVVGMLFVGLPMAPYTAATRLFALRFLVEGWAKAFLGEAINTKITAASKPAHDRRVFIGSRLSSHRISSLGVPRQVVACKRSARTEPNASWRAPGRATGGQTGYP